VLFRQPHAAPGQRVGLLGGSFDPPHDGHVHITRWALRAFDLDRVWWMVTPGNPLKARGPAETRRRMEACARMMRHPRVTITDIETRLGTRATADTIDELRARWPSVRFVWLMGADNLATFHRWERWDRIMETVPVGVLARPGQQLFAGLAPAARRYARFRLPEHRARALPFRAPAALVASDRADVCDVFHRNPLAGRVALKASRRAFLAGGLSALAPFACAAPVPPRRPQPGEGGSAAARLVAERLPSGRAGFVLLDLETGETLDALAPDELFAPASVAKIPTALYALDVLGPDRRFRTEVVATGAVVGRRVEGDLALVGGGDPELDSGALAGLAARAAERVDSVSGRFVVDPGLTPSLPRIDDDQPVDAAYNPGLGGLNLNYNRVRFRWRRKGDAVETALEAHAVGASPPTGAVALALEGPDCDCPIFAHEPASRPEIWRVRRDALNGEGSVWLPVRGAAAYAADVFRTLSAEAGLALPAPAPGRVPDGAAPLAAHESRTMIEIVADMLDYSTNLTAEAVGMAATLARGAQARTLADSAAEMARWAGLEGDPGFALSNHSGLSAASAVSPRLMAELLRRSAGGALPGLLEERRIDDRGAAAPEGTVVVGKTGTLDFARGLAGYATAPSGRKLVYAWFANDLARREATRGMGRRPPGARGWRNRATALERALLREWVGRFG
jgi:D-alanyl-D-alanine carboxypeptidase/D-alanyl-D-alanine-endopeptidase (penicillin-binding protein 4)